jgi:hypothetical protein
MSETIVGWQSYRFHPGAVIPCNDPLSMIALNMEGVYLRRRVDGSKALIYKAPKPLNDWLGVANYVTVALALSLLLLIARMVIR